MEQEVKREESHGAFVGVGIIVLILVVGAVMMFLNRTSDYGEPVDDQAEVTEEV